MSGRVDWQRSEYYRKNPKVRECYSILAQRLGTDQFLWCYLDRGEYKYCPGDHRVEWVLTVPEDAVLAYYDECAWHHLIGEDVTFRQWHEASLMAHRGDSRAQDRFIEECKRQYDLPEQQLWDRLIVPSDSDAIRGVLLEHPLNRKWIHWVVPVDRSRFPAGGTV